MRFVDADALLHHLLDRKEKGVACPRGYPDYARFPSPSDSDRFARRIEEVRRKGLVKVKLETGLRRGEVRQVRLLDPDGLYGLLGRTPTATAAASTRDQVLDGLAISPGILENAEPAFDAWARQKTWCRLGIENVDEMRQALRLAEAFVRGDYLGLDYRTFSRRSVQDSKALERLETAVLRLISGSVDIPSAGLPRAVFAALGLERIGQPLLVAGPVEFKDSPGEIPTAYIGIPPSEITKLRFTRKPAYLLTIENLVSFNRHVLDADPQKIGVTIYVGGYPSLGTQAALEWFGKSLPDSITFFHWSDIDPDGTWIYRTVEKAAGRKFRPHLMSVDLAERHGTPIANTDRARSSCSADSAISNLVEYFLRPDAKTVEQEEIEPEIPVLFLK